MINGQLGLVLLSVSLALVFNIVFSLNGVYRRQILGLYRMYRHEAYIRVQQSHLRQVPPYVLGLVFVCLSLLAAGQFLSQGAHHTFVLHSDLRNLFDWRNLLLLNSLLFSLALGLLIASIDYKVHLIPSHLVLLLALCLVLASIVSPQESAIWNIQRALCVYVLLRLGFQLMTRLSGKEGIGLGDINLLSALALWFDVYSCLYLIMIASLLGLVYIFMHNICATHKAPIRVIAFGPWMICASLILLQISVLESS